LKLVNLGCGTHCHPDWINLDRIPTSPDVLYVDALEKLPFEESSVDALYSSHVVEHLSCDDARVLLKDVRRILRTDGLIRIVTPDLETIVLTYLAKLDDALEGKPDADYEYQWMLLELLDQSVRESRGGKMGRFLRNPELQIHDFIRSRVGQEAEECWDRGQPCPLLWDKLRSVHPRLLVQYVKNLMAKVLVRCVAGRDAAEAFETGLFRHSGEVHLWLYDRYSLRRLLADVGFVDIRVCRADESLIPGFNRFGLDIVCGAVRKPDSLFMEARKP